MPTLSITRKSREFLKNHEASEIVAETIFSVGPFRCQVMKTDSESALIAYRSDLFQGHMKLPKCTRNAKSKGTRLPGLDADISNVGSMPSKVKLAITAPMSVKIRRSNQLR